MRIFFVLGLFFFISTAFAQVVKPDPCNLKGSVFIEPVKSRAYFSVFVDENSPTVDLIVYKVDKKLYADRPGLWHITDDKAIADFIVYIEKSRAGANLTIQFTPTESFAGCTKN